jgi:hypothetical protein
MIIFATTYTKLNLNDRLNLGNAIAAFIIIVITVNLIYLLYRAY